MLEIKYINLALQRYQAVCLQPEKIEGFLFKTIDFEAHFVTSEWIDALKNNKGYPRIEEDK